MTSDATVRTVVVKCHCSYGQGRRNMLSGSQLYPVHQECSTNHTHLERRSKVCATLLVLICIKRRRLGTLSAKIILGRGVHARSLCLFLSFYIFLTSIARMSKFILLTNWDSLLGHTREADEMFKKNSERQNKWMSRNWFANYPKTGIDRLKQFRIFRNILNSQLVRSRPRRCAHSDCVGLW